MSGTLRFFFAPTQVNIENATVVDVEVATNELQAAKDDLVKRDTDKPSNPANVNGLFVTMLLSLGAYIATKKKIIKYNKRWVVF